MSEKVCGNCKYKGESIKYYDCDIFKEVDTGYSTCKIIEHDNGWRYKRGLGALVTDGSGYFAALCVENNFGCNKWELS